MIAMLLAAALLQQPDSSPKFMQKKDARFALAVAGGTAAFAIFDERIARWTRQPNVQGDSARHRLVKKVTVVNEMPLTVAAVATYGIGRLTGQETVADVGWHVTESLLLTTGVAEVIRVGSGRLRPRASPHDAFVFEPGKGLTKFENRSFPSLHAAVAFTTAASLVEEIRIRRPNAVKYAAPALYTVALVPGFTRLYLDQHWASDVFAGTLLGAWIGQRVVRYSHGRRTRLDRLMLGAVVLPSADGTTIGWSFRH